MIQVMEILLVSCLMKLQHKISYLSRMFVVHTHNMAEKTADCKVGFNGQSTGLAIRHNSENTLMYQH